MSDDLVTRIHLAISEFDDARVADCAHEAAKEIERLRALHATACAELFRVDAEACALRPLLAAALAESGRLREILAWSSADPLLSEIEDLKKARAHERCGTCRDWRGDTSMIGGCDSPTSICADAWGAQWPASHGCPSWRAKEGQ